MTRFFYDCEFIEDGQTIDLISIGIVADDGREFYAISSEFSLAKLHANKWLVDNVLPHLPLMKHPPGVQCRCFHGHLDTDHPDVRPRAQIARAVKDFLLSGDGDPELWAWYAAYDHVCLCQLWGQMIDLPEGIPMYTQDLKQEVDRLEKTLGREIQLPDQPDGEHNALVDARHNLTRALYLDELWQNHLVGL